MYYANSKNEPAAPLKKLLLFFIFVMSGKFTNHTEVLSYEEDST